MSGWTIYFITRMDGLHVVFIVLCTLSMVTTAIFGILAAASCESKDKKSMLTELTWAKKMLVYTIIAGLILALTPTTKETAAIYLLPKIVNNEQCQQIPANAVELLNAKLQSWINDTLIEDTKPAE